jgi:hypothetical protein
LVRLLRKDTGNEAQAEQVIVEGTEEEEKGEGEATQVRHA